MKGFDKELVEEANLYVQKDIRSNSRFNLALYNLVNTKHGKYKTSKIKNIGEAPHILDSPLVEISRIELEKYLKSKSFFNAKVKSDIKVKKKKAYLTFTADQGSSFRIRNYTRTINDSAIAKVYNDNFRVPFKIKPGYPYDADSVVQHREQVYLTMKRKGYFDFLRQYTRYEVDSNLQLSLADVKMTLTNPLNRKSHSVYHINNTFFTIKNTRDDAVEPRSMILDSQYHYSDFSNRFRLKALNRYLFFKKGDIYNIDNENLTYDRLYALNVFKNVKIEYVKTSDSTKLDAKIEVVPLKKMSNRVEGEYTFNSGRNGFNIGNTFTNHNLFGGAEQLEVKLKYGILYDARSSTVFDNIFNRDFQAGLNIVFPKLLVPFKTSKVELNGLPHTTVSSSLQIFDQVSAFSNRIFINSLTYDWVETKYKLHSFTPFNIEYRDGRFDPVFRDSLENKGYQLYVRTNDRRYFTLGSQYAYTYNNLRLNTKANFLYFRGAVDVSGNTLGLLGSVFNFKRDNDGFRTVFNLPYLQYTKGEVDLRWYRYLGKERQLVARINPGVIFSYGNNKALPFEKNFYAGGSGGIRAWQARTLGPGNYNREVLPDDKTRRNLRNLDQLGEIKLEGNLEYRFKILSNFFGSKLKGATFTDFGNIWRTKETEENPGGKIEFNKVFKQLAIGAGAGLRFDVEYFVFRFDAGIKVKDPQFVNDQWVIRHVFDSEFKQNYNTTHSPDQYRFIQYNFGIGMPF